MISPYKTGTCITCSRQNSKLTAGRCIEYPYCYKKHRNDISIAKKQNSLKTSETKHYIIPTQSDKRKKIDAIYNIAAAHYKKQYPECMAKLPGCMIRTSDVHHLHSGKDKLKYYLDQKKWITVCPSCHFKIHNEMGKDELIKLGLKIIEP